MRHSISKLSALTLLLGSVLLPMPALAGGPSAVYVFGDSLSDTGNLAEKVYRENFLDPPSFHDSYTNGPVAMELLAESYGLRADPSLWANGFTDQHHLFGAGFVPGTNYAVAGATATDRGLANLNLDLPHQVSAFVAHTGGNGHAPSDALYAMLIGGNDVRDSAQALNTIQLQTGITSELTQLQVLINDGARHLLVSNLPDIGLIPEFTSGPANQDQAAHADSLLYNSELLAGVNALRAANPTVNIGYFDLYSFSNAVIANAASYGFTNTTDACYTSGVTDSPVTTSPGCGPVTPTGAANIAQYVFWDDIHPTAGVHELWSQGLIAAAAVPEPGSESLFIAGLVIVGAAWRRRGTRPRLEPVR